VRHLLLAEGAQRFVVGSEGLVIRLDRRGHGGAAWNWTWENCRT
jgi:hypothetical protein